MRRIFSQIIAVFMVMLVAVHVLAGDGGEGISNAKRRMAADKAIKLLAGKELKHPSGKNGSAVVHALAGLAFIAAGSTHKKGDYQRNIKACVQKVIELAGTTSNTKKAWDQTTWGLAHAVIFLAELEAYGKDKKIHAAIKEFVQKLQAYQGKDGGWCHGDWASGPNPLGYRQFTAPTIVTLIALGFASKVGVKIDRAVVKRGLEYLIASSGSDGAVGYSPNKGQKGFGYTGRNGGALLAFLAIGEGKHAFLPQIVRFMQRDFARLERGHGSALLHLMEGAMACFVLGVEQWNVFWNTYSANMIKRQKPDGGFTPPPGDGVGSQRMEMGDRCTAIHALLLLLPECRLKLLGSLEYPQDKNLSYSAIHGKAYRKRLKEVARLVQAVERMAGRKESPTSLKKKVSLYVLSEQLDLDEETAGKVAALTKEAAAMLNESRDAVRKALEGDDMRAAEKVIAGQARKYSGSCAKVWFDDAKACARNKAKYLQLVRKRDKGGKISRKKVSSMVKRMRHKQQKTKTPEWADCMEDIIRKIEELAG